MRKTLAIYAWSIGNCSLAYFALGKFDKFKNAYYTRKPTV